MQPGRLNLSIYNMKLENKIVIITASLGVAFWIVDALLGHLFFIDGSFWDLLILDVHPHEIFFRLMLFFVLLIVGLYSHKSLRKHRRIENALRESENRFRKTVENINDGVTIVEKDKVVYANDRACEIFGYPYDEFTTIDGDKLVAPEDLKRVRSIIDEKMKTGSYPDEMEYWIVRKNGTRRYVHNSYSTSFENGAIVSRYVLTSDITESKLAGDALRNSEDQYHTTIDSLADGIHAVERDYNVVMINRALLKWHEKVGVETDIIGRNLFEIYPFLPDKVRDEYERVFESAETITTAEETELSGRLIITETRKIPVVKNGEVVRVITVLRDITARKKAEEKLRKREMLLRATIDSLPFDFFAVDTNHRYIIQNKVCVDNWGELIGKKPEEAAPNDKIKEIWLNEDSRAFAGETIDEEVIYPFDGDRRHIHTIVSPIIDGDNTIGILGINMDITKRKQAEEARMESEERFRLAFHTSPDAINISRVESGEFVMINDGFKSMTGFTEDEVIGKSSIEINLWNDPDDRHKMMEALKKDGFIRNWENKFRMKNGQLKTALLSAKIINLNGAPHILTVTRDIGDIKKAEEALRESEERFRTLFETAHDAIFIKNRDLEYVAANPSMERFTGLPVAEIIGKRDEDIFDADMSRQILESDQKVLDGEIINQEQILPVGSENRYLTVVRVPMRDAEGRINGICGIARDVTRTRRLQEFAVRAQRLETAGRIAGQVAHDFNNLLGPLVAFPELIKDEVTESPRALKYLNSMEKSARKIADINQQLLTLGRRAHYEQAPLRLNGIIREVLDQIQPPADNIEVVTELDEKLMNVMGGAAQIHRVIANLVVNAYDAMSDGGVLTVTTENYYLDDSSGDYERIPKGEYVKLIVADTGNGMPPEVLNKIFDPFFTTKATDKRRGSGLGLSVVHAVMEDHNGYIDCHSVPDAGSSFFLYFPITRENVEKPEDEQIYGGNETIMVVDDDSEQREVCVKLLEKLGYSVMTADSGENALEILKKTPVDLVLLDMIMPPGIDGAETYRRILSLIPSQKAIIVSGYARSERAKLALQLGAFGFLRKPLTLKSLAGSIRKALDTVPQHAS